MKIVFLDTETTGNEITRDRLCQVCWMKDGEYHTEYFKPPIPISVKSTSITHITNKMVADMPDFATSLFKKDLESVLTDHILVAHNAKFDIAMLVAEGVAVPRHICTLRVARYLDPENKIPEYGLQFLRYFLELEVDGLAHDAEGDVRVLERIFARLFEKIKTNGHYADDEEVLDAMLRISATPSLFAIFPFGKYKGARIEDVAKTDKGYLEWLLKQKLADGEQDEDWIFTLKTYVG
jgi:DNA polymerase III alpha subunit (gram-positive type)